MARFSTSFEWFSFLYKLSKAPSCSLFTCFNLLDTNPVILTLSGMSLVLSPTHVELYMLLSYVSSFIWRIHYFCSEFLCQVFLLYLNRNPFRNWFDKERLFFVPLYSFFFSFLRFFLFCSCFSMFLSFYLFPSILFYFLFIFALFLFLFSFLVRLA